HTDGASPQFKGEISEIGVAGYEDDNIRPHLDRKLDCIDCHHDVNVRLVTAFFGGRPVFGYDHESIGAQPLHELVLLFPLFLPDRDGRWKSGIDHHLDQAPSCIWPREEVTELQPVETAPGRTPGTADVRFIHQPQQSLPSRSVMTSFSHDGSVYFAVFL